MVVSGPAGCGRCGALPGPYVPPRPSGGGSPSTQDAYHGCLTSTDFCCSKIISNTLQPKNGKAQTNGAPAQLAKRAVVHPSRATPSGISLKKIKPKEGDRHGPVPIPFMLNSLKNPSISIFAFIKLQRHNITHGSGLITVIKRPLHSSQIAFGPLQFLDSINLSQRMHANILGQSKGLGGALNVAPHGLARPVLFRVTVAREHPMLVAVPFKPLQQICLEIDPALFSGLALRDPELRPQLVRLEGKDIPDP